MDRPQTNVASVRTVPPMRVRRRSLPALALLAAVATLAGCAKDAPQDTWQPAGENAQKIQDLQWWIFGLAGLVGVIVFGAIIFVVIRFRDRGQPIPKQTHGKPALEIFLTV